MDHGRRVSLIAAMAENRVIGINNGLPWHLPADLRYFRRLTSGHHVIMGRRNYESIGKPLSNRTNIVVTRNTGYRAPGCIVTHTLDDALATPRDDPEIFVIGGAEIYRQTLPLADRIYLTLIHAQVEGDTCFPEFDDHRWQQASRDRHEADAKNPYAYSFLIYDRKQET